MIGNTWDGLLARKLATAALAYMQPFLDEQANERAETHRVAARFACIIMRMRQPARWAWRRWREACIDDESKWAVEERIGEMTHDGAWRNLAA